MFTRVDRRRWPRRGASHTLQIETLECRRYLAADMQLLTETGSLDNGQVDTPVIPVATVAESLVFQPELFGLEGTLWATNGTALGTRELNIDLTGKQILGGVAFQGDLLLAVATTDTPGYSATFELWTVDLVESLVFRIKEVPNVQVPLGGVFEMVVAGSFAYFSVDTQATGNELWKSDATESGTGLVAEVAAGSSSATPQSFTVVGDALFFTASDGAVGRQVWWTDGSGLQRVTDDRLFFQGSGERREQFVAGPGYLAFTARTSLDASFSLWTTTGPLDPPTTALISDLGWETSSAFPRRLAANDHAAFVVKQTSPLATQLWATETGDTVARTGSFNFWVSSLVATEDRVFFLDRTPVGATTLWTSDADDVTEVTALMHGSASSSERVGQLFAIDTRVAFAYDDRGLPGLHGNELWISDGTAQGTFMPRDLNRGHSESGEPLGSDPTGFIASSEFLFFQADNGTNGIELFSMPMDIAQRRLTAVLEGTHAITSPGVGSTVVTVTYETDDGDVPIDSDTFGDTDLRLVGPDGSRNLFMSRTPGPQPGPTAGSYRVDYRLAPPATVWRAEHNGVYTIRLDANEVKDASGNAVFGGNLGAFAVAIPTAKLTGAAEVTADGQTESFIEIQYDDYVDDVELVSGAVVERTGNMGIDVATLDGSDLHVTDSVGNRFGTLEFVSAQPPVSGSRVTATYRLVPDGGTWDVTENGTYHILLQPSQVTDLDGHAVVSETPLGTLEVDIVDAERPTVEFSIDTGIRAVGVDAELDIRYRDDGSIDRNSLDDGDLTLLDAEGQLIENVDLVLVSSLVDSSDGSVLATYRIGPSDPPLFRPVSGTYTLTLLADAVSDAVGNGNVATELGSVVVGWTHPTNRFDVNDSGGDASPTDALAVLNELTGFAWADPTDGSLPFVTAAAHRYYDVNGDGYVSPTDALAVLHRLDELNSVDAEPVSGAVRVADRLSVADLIRDDRPERAEQPVVEPFVGERPVVRDVAMSQDRGFRVRSSNRWRANVDALFARDPVELRLETSLLTDSGGLT